MSIRLNYEAFVSPLPDMAAAVVKAVITADMRCHEPLHPTAEVVCPFRRYQQVKVVGHYAPGQHLDRVSFSGFSHKMHKGTVVTVSVKDLLTTVTSVYNVVDLPIGQSPCYSWHAVLLVFGCALFM
jgi:hypothetical protein